MLALSHTSSHTFEPTAASYSSANTDRDLGHKLYCVSSAQIHTAKHTIFFEGDSAENVFEIVEGVVKLYKMTFDGRCQVTGFLYPGQLFGLGHKGCYVQSAEALTPVELRRYPKAAFESTMDRHPELASRMLSEISSELVRAQDQMLLLGRKSAMERLCSFLLYLSEDSERRSESENEIYLPMSRGEIGDYLGLTCETVCRTIRRLKDLSVINLPDARNVVVLDRDGLIDLAESGAVD